MEAQIESFIEYCHKVKGTSQNTELSYRRDLYQLAGFLRAQYQMTRVEDLTATALYGYIRFLEEKQRKAATISRNIASIRAFCHYLVREGVLMMDVGYTNDPYIISQNDRFVAINSALQVDLTGQVCADSLGTKFWSGVGGQIDFVYGASLSKGGKAIIAMPSITTKGVSKIAPVLDTGAGVVTTRNHIHWLVTENGAVDLYGKTLQERARLVISIAHPSAQEELDRAAFERFGSHHHYIKGYMK